MDMYVDNKRRKAEQSKRTKVGTGVIKSRYVVQTEAGGRGWDASHDGLVARGRRKAELVGEKGQMCRCVKLCGVDKWTPQDRG